MNRSVLIAVTLIEAVAMGRPMIGWRGRGALAVLALAVLAACGLRGDELLTASDQTAIVNPAASTGTSSTTSGSAESPALVRTEWQLTQAREGSRTRDLTEHDGVLRFDGEGHFSGRGCNHFGGDVTIRADRLSASGVGSTMMGCSGVRGELDALLTRPLTDGARWSISSGTLTIESGDTVHTFRQRDAAFPSRNTTALVQGEIGDAEYRLSWQQTDGNIGVDWESRDRPGVGFGTVGMGRPADFDVGYLDPMSGRVAGRAFVFVVVPKTMAKVMFEPTGAGKPVELQTYAIEPATTWRVAAGFVGARSQGGAVVGYDPSGQEQMRSRALPG